MNHRKKPFSHKQKKEQLKDKRQRQKPQSPNEEEQGHEEEEEVGIEKSTNSNEHSKNSKPLSFKPIEFVKATSNNSSRENPLLSNIYGAKESRESIAELKAQAMLPLTGPLYDDTKSLSGQPRLAVDPALLEVGYEDLYPTQLSMMDIPKRPPWSPSFSKEKLESNERRYFSSWLENTFRLASQADTLLSQNEKPEDSSSMSAKEGGIGKLRLSMFEQNLEVWRQLWRVCEISDVVLFVVDVRHPILHFPPSMHKYVTEELKKPLVVVFTKIDLVSADTLFAWKEYFKEKFPGICVASFSIYSHEDFTTNGSITTGSSNSAQQSIINDSATVAALQRRVKRQKKRYLRAVGVRDVLSACSQVKLNKSGVEVDWDQLIEQYGREHENVEDFIINEDEDQEEDDDEGEIEETKEKDSSNSTLEVDDFKALNPHDHWITIGLVGHPNTGKSSLINGIMGKKVVSASRTPGHTKHFQTIHLTPSVRLCDCPGLVFPSFIPKTLQILCGISKIAQVSDPYTSVKYLAQRIDLARVLNLKEYPEEDVKKPWSAWSICQSFAIQRGFFTAHGARPDVHRSANLILRLTADGRILLSFKPKGFFTDNHYQKVRERELELELKEMYNSNCNDNSSSESEGDEGEDFRKIVDERGKPRMVTGGAFNALLSLETPE